MRTKSNFSAQILLILFLCFSALSQAQQKAFGEPKFKQFPLASESLPQDFALLSTTPKKPKIEQNILDSKGSNFWITFMPNFHNIPSLLEDSLYIFIAADSVTSGKIEYTNMNGQSFSQSFTITDPNKIYSYQVVYKDFELVGFNDSGSFPDPNSQNEKVIKTQAFHITSDKEVTVYGLDQANTTSDAFLALPVDALGIEYRIMSYNSDGNGFTSGSPSPTPSEFAIVATEDNTLILITPTSPTWSKGTATQNISLNKGDVYLVQSLINATQSTNDLTGTKITSSKPIAVFAGHQRSKIPEINDQLISRDYLAEQLLPVSTWGKSAFLTPYQKSSNESSIGTDMFRIMAGYNNTEIFLDGVSKGIFNTGQFYESLLVTSAQVKASGPILVAQFKKTSQAGSTSQAFGDPFMMLIPPSEQFMDSYRIINAQCYGGTPPVKTYYEQYVAVVIPTKFITSLRLDNSTTATSLFQSIGTSGYSYANILVSDGVHFLKADTTFGLQVYGYGVANSYGYIGGLRLEQIVPPTPDFNPPVITGEIDCFRFLGTIYDSAAHDSGITTASISQATNVITVATNPKFPMDSLKFTASLIDFLQDGSFTITAKDSAGNTSSKSFNIPGFTTKIDTILNGNGLAIRNDVAVSGSPTKCFTFNLTNYGKFPQRIDSLALSQIFSQYSISKSNKLPIFIQPGERRSIEICFTPSASGTFFDTLYISNDCARRAAAALQLVVTAMPISCPTTSGIVNIYAPVFAISGDRTTVALENNPGYSAGDQVLIIQMQGATIDPSNTAQYGAIASLNGAGNYEFAIVQSVIGNALQFTKPLLHSDFNVNGKIQVVSVATYDHVTITGTIQAKPWDGKIGGVIAIEANCLAMEAGIDASGIGFRGGKYSNQIGCVVNPQSIDYVSLDSCLFSWKGEGIAGNGIYPKYFGKGSPANAGGGGNNSNGGGGGGGNYGAGGIGGFGYSGIPGQNRSQGIGGKSLFTYFDWKYGKVFMGGGSGAGQTNNQHGTGGANGGGIIFVRAGSIRNPSYLSISANGNNALNDSAITNPDGCGGGGAGGSVILDIRNKLYDGLSINANGGKGGSRVKSSLMTSGTGGGGAGGFIGVTKDIGKVLIVQPSVVGGKAGKDPEGTSYGAADGTNGMYSQGFVITEYSKPILTECVGCYPVILNETSDCGTYKFTVSDMGYPIQTLDLVTTASTNVVMQKSAIPANSVNVVITLINKQLGGNFVIYATNANGKIVGYSGTVLAELKKPVVSQKGDTLICDVKNAVKYQWYWNGQPLGLGLWNIYRLTFGGSYTVQITDKNGCAAISDAFSPDVSEVGETKIANGAVRVFPNPVSDELEIKGTYGIIGQELSIELINLLGGREAQISTIGGEFSAEISVKNLPTGMYILRIKSGSEIIQTKVVKR